MKLYLGDCLEILPAIEANSVDTLITDPPAGINFMGEEWDSNRGGRDAWIAWLTAVLSECYRVLKPGAMALVWAIPRTSHWTGTAIENAGFEIRDQIYHLFGSGFPKSLDISKAIDKAAGAEREVIGIRVYADGTRAHGGKNGNNKYAQDRWTQNPDNWQTRETAPTTNAAKTWHGYGTALKPAAEVWWLAMKPIDGTFANNALTWGVAGLNIDECRIPGEAWKRSTPTIQDIRGNAYNSAGDKRLPREPQEMPANGRYPANVTHDGSDEVMAEFARYGETPSNARKNKSNGSGEKYQSYSGGLRAIDRTGYADDSGTAARFFYCAKASRSERTNNGKVENNHPTVKPLALCRYLARLTKTPTGGVVLDPFMGSGSVGIAALLEGRDFIGIEKNEGNYQIAAHRIEDWQARIACEGAQMELDV